MPPKHQHVTKILASSNSGLVNRLVIRDIEVENFKSYAGKHCVGPFHKTFTTVIGPNGSGKSNVIDSMLFVFGKSARKIRVEGKLSDLIHNSAAHPNVPSASVTVNFVEITDDPKDPNQRIEIPDTQLSITRRVTRSGQSGYYIDGRSATQKEVVDLLKSKGVDLDHNRFLILQGEVEQIAMMKPRADKEGEEGLVEYFDDLIGTNAMIEQINEASRRAAEAYESRLDLLTKLSEAQSERDKMSDAKNACLDYITKHNELQRLISIVSQKAAVGVRAAMQQDLARLAVVSSEKEAHDERLKTQEEEMKRLDQLTREAVKEREKAEKEIQAIEALKQKTDEELAAKKTALDAHEKSRKKDADNVRKYKDLVSATRLEVENIGRDKDIAEQRKGEARNFLADNEADFEKQQDELADRLSGLRQQENKLVQNIAPFARAVVSAEQELETARSKLDDLNRAEHDRAQQIARLHDKISRESDHLARVEQQLASSDSASSNLRERLEEAEAERDKYTQQKNQIGQIIESKKAETKAGAADDQVTSFLCSQRSLKGYLGPLRTLGRIDDRFDVAAGVAGGGVWGFHVVDNEHTAVDAMNLLKQENRGRASFIPLTRITAEFGPAMNNDFNTPPNSKRLFDLISCADEKVRPAFYFAVRNTLVTETLTRARELGLARGERFKCVTVDGSLVDPSGTITGGGDGRPRGADLKGTGQVKSNDKRAEMIQQLKELQGKLQEVFQLEQQAQEAVNQLQFQHRQAVLQPNDYSKLKRQLIPLKTSIESDRNALELLERQQQQQQASAGANLTNPQHQRPDKEALQRDIEVHYETLEAKKRELDIKKHDLIEIRERMKAATGFEFQQFEQRMKDMRAQEQEADKRLSDLNRDQAKKQAAIDQRENEIANLERKIAASATEANQHEREAVLQLQNEVKGLVDKIQQHKGGVSDIDDRLDELKSKKDDVAEKKAFENSKIQECIRQQNEIEESLKPAREKMAKLLEKKVACEREIIDNIQKFGIQTWKQAYENERTLRRGGDDDGDGEGEGEDYERDSKTNRRSNNNNNSNNQQSKSKKQHKAKANKIKKEAHCGNDDDDENDQSASSSSDDDDDEVDNANEDAATPSQRKSSSNKNSRKRIDSASKLHMLRQSQLASFGPSQDGSPSAKMIRKVAAGEAEFDPATFTTSLSVAELETFSVEQTRFTAQEYNAELIRVKEKINFDAVAQWLELDEVYRRVKEQHDDIVASYNRYHGEEERLKEERRVKFLATFGVIQHKLKEVYQTITRCGDAELELVDSSDPFEGIRFTVRPPRKAWKAIGNLSGGEKTLSSLALVFALHHIRPTPVYVLDEIDAALDFRNVAIVGKYILEKGIGAQFIIISLRNNMFELAHQIVGISKVSDCTRSIVISPKFLSERIAEAARLGLAAIRARASHNNNNNNNNNMIVMKQQQADIAASLRNSGGGENMQPEPAAPRTSHGSNKKHKAEEDDKQ